MVEAILAARGESYTRMFVVAAIIHSHDPASQLLRHSPGEGEVRTLDDLNMHHFVPRPQHLATLGLPRAHEDKKRICNLNYNRWRH